MKSLIAPSILAADFSRLGEEIQSVVAAGADVIHFDVMDNHYVPNLSFGPVVLDSLRKLFPDVPFDVHLMVKPVDSMIDAFLASGASYISIHPESTEHVHGALRRIRDGGAKAGIVLNPDTPLHTVEHLYDDLDLLLIMSVNPGFGGQAFIPMSVEKIRQARELLDLANRDIRLEVDGGITKDNIAVVSHAGADMFVAGSAIFGSQDYGATIRNLRTAIDSVPANV